MLNEGRQPIPTSEIDTVEKLREFLNERNAEVQSQMARYFEIGWGKLNRRGKKKD